MDRFGRHLRQPALAPEVAPVVEPTPIETPAVAEQPYVAAEPTIAEPNQGFVAGIKERVSGAYAGIKERHAKAIRRAKYVGATALAVAAVGYGLEAVAGGSDGPADAHGANTPSKLAADFSNQPNCKDFAFNDVSSNPNLYTSEAFLPKIGENESAADYVNGLFAKDGALTNDAHSLAAVMATIVEPALRSSINDPNYNYLDTYKSKLAAYEANGGQAVAAEDCETAYDVMSQIADENSDWAGQGDHVSLFAADRSDKNRIDGATLTKPWVVQANQLGGIEFELTQTAKGLNGQKLEGFPSVLILNSPGKNNAVLLVKGLAPTQAGSSTQETGHKQHQKHKKNQHNHHMNHKGTEQGQVSTGSAGGSVSTTETQASTGTSTTAAPGSTEGQGGTPSNGSFGTTHKSGESNVPGPVKETGPGNVSGNGGPTGHQPGNAPSYGGGGPGAPGTGEGTPTTPAPAPEQPTTPTTPAPAPEQPTTPTTPAPAPEQPTPTPTPT